VAGWLERRGWCCFHDHHHTCLFDGRSPLALDRLLDATVRPLYVNVALSFAESGHWMS
jgi:hypothetical protein